MVSFEELPILPSYEELDFVSLTEIFKDKYKLSTSFDYRRFTGKMELFFLGGVYFSFLFIYWFVLSFNSRRFFIDYFRSLIKTKT